MKESASAVALCDTNGQVMGGNEDLARMLGAIGLRETISLTLSEMAGRLDYAGLPEQFAEFAASERAEEQIFQAEDERRIFLRRLDGPPGQRWVLIEFQPPLTGEQAALSEAGRMTARLIHDFKNQMGGLKLYAAFLKKSLADQPEAAEIAEKIIAGLNAMSEHANLVARLTRPLKLKLEVADLAALISQVVRDLQPQATLRAVALTLEVADDPPWLLLDTQQVRAALYALLARALRCSPEGGTVRVKLHWEGATARIEISSRERLEEARLAAFFDCLGEHRITETSLGLALAKRIIEQHGGQAAALAAPPDGVLVRLRLPLR
jgi:signal transduction histidine kinase